MYIGLERSIVVLIRNKDYDRIKCLILKRIHKLTKPD